MRRSAAVIAAIALTGIAATPVLAKDYKGKGTIEYQILASEAVGGENAGKVRLKYQGTVSQEGEANPVTGNVQTCTGIFTVDDKGVATAGAGYCDGVDTDGDAWVLHFRQDKKGGKWNMAWGTGKFEGVKGGGTTKSLEAPAEDKLAIAWEGAWTMK